jgi:hypothetical protein
MATTEKTMLRIVLDKETHKKLKLESVELDTTMQAIIEELIRSWLSQRGKKRVSLRGITDGNNLTDEDFDEAKIKN